ncbi:MAG TPA: hypothetical protein DCW68_00790 [Rhodospirillaceae bacterium]|nr:MAG: hypothetical protein A2018_00820 [Alphaproteobacteria bacterium GWF2_58_20]HAU28636.1 hypothetical protein [Rhodospirillaceae bacterium]
MMLSGHIVPAWRNLLRNRRRTLVTVGAVAFTMALLVLVGALSEGMVQGLIRNVTETSMGLVQAHAPGYLSDPSFYTAMEHSEVLEAAAKDAGISVARRSFGGGLLAYGDKSAGARIWGVVPEMEKAFRFSGSLAEGTFLSAKTPPGSVVLGRKIAHLLKAGIGDDIVVLVQASDGSVGNELLRVVGVFAPIGDDFDRSAAVISSADFEHVFVSGGRVHELAFLARDGRSAETLVSELEPFAEGAVLRTWRQLMPPISDMDLMMRGMMVFVGLVFSLAAGFGIVNTMMMAVHERVREYGVLKALGCTPLRLFVDTSIEALLMGGVGTVLGGLVGQGLVVWFIYHPIDLSRIVGDMSLVGVAFDPLWRAASAPDLIFLNAVVMLVLCWGVSILPALRAARLNPVEAMNHDG